MSKKNLSLMAASLLLVSMPLIAQVPEAPLEPPAEQAAEEAAQPQATAPESQPAEYEAETEATEVTATDEAAFSAEDETREMPKTASPLALMALAGVAGIGSAAGLRWLKRK